MKYGLSINTAATDDPVTLTEAKVYLRVDSSIEDDLITSLITAATKWCQNYTGRQFVTQTFDQTFDTFPSGRSIELARPPLVSVTSLAYTDTAGDAQTVATSVYGVRDDKVPGELYLKSGQSWPATLVQDGVVTVTYIAGYGAASAVPGSIKLAIKTLVAHWFVNREPVITGSTSSTVQMATESLLDEYRVLDAH